MEQLKFDAENIIGDGTAYAVEKVFSVFSRQSGDQMSDYADSTRCKPVYSFFVYGERITSSDALCGDFVGGLKTEFHPEKRSVVQIGQIVFDIRAKAVRPGSDSESRAQRVAERFFKSLFQQGDRRIGIGEILKICDAAKIRPFFPQNADLSVDLRRDRRNLTESVFSHRRYGDSDAAGFRPGFLSKNPLPCKIAGTGLRTEDASAQTCGTVAVGTGEASVDGYFCNSRAEPIFQIGADAVIMRAVFKHTNHSPVVSGAVFHGPDCLPPIHKKRLSCYTDKALNGERFSLIIPKNRMRYKEENRW